MPISVLDTEPFKPMELGAGVYKIQNTVNGKFYIGSSNCIRRRFTQHRNSLRGGYHHNQYLQYAWEKYGETAFTFTVLIICTQDTMRFYEQRIICSWNPTYNLSGSAYSGVPAGGVLTDEHKEKVRLTSIKAWASNEYRVKVTHAIRAAMTQEECLKRSARTKQLWADPIYREKAIKIRKGNAYSKGYKCTPVQVLNRKRAARISNIKRNYGDMWKSEYIRRYPEYAGDIDA